MSKKDIQALKNHQKSSIVVDEDLENTKNINDSKENCSINEKGHENIVNNTHQVTEM